MIQKISNLDVDYFVTIPDPPQLEKDILFAGNKIVDQYWVKPPVPRTDEFSSRGAKVNLGTRRNHQSIFSSIPEGWNMEYI